MTKVRQMIIRNLQLLSFDPHASGIEDTFGPNMFKSANEKGLQAILTFLICQTKTSYAKRYRGCWPVYDAQQRTEWRKVTLAILQELEKDFRLPAGSASPSRLVTASGAR